MLDPFAIWQNTLSELPTSKGPEWANLFAGKVDGLVTGKMQIATISPPSVFTFNKAAFAATLLQALPVADPASGMLKFANAFEAGCLASTMVVSSGAAFGAPTPATIWSAPPICIIDPPSIVAAKALLLAQLISAPPVPDAKIGKFPSAFFSAFKLLTCSTTGINSVPPPAGPQPLLAPLQPVS